MGGGQKLNGIQMTQLQSGELINGQGVESNARDVYL